MTGEITKLDAILAIFTTPSGDDRGEENMTVSRNVQQETMKALRESSSQHEAAAKLGISQPGLSYRIKGDKDLLELAVSRGFIRGKGPERPGVTEAAKILGVAPTISSAISSSSFPGAASAQPEDREGKREKEEPVIEHDRVFEKPEPLIAFKGAVVFFGEKLWVDVRVERRV